MAEVNQPPLPQLQAQQKEPSKNRHSVPCYAFAKAASEAKPMQYHLRQTTNLQDPAMEQNNPTAPSASKPTSEIRNTRPQYKKL